MKKKAFFLLFITFATCFSHCAPNKQNGNGVTVYQPLRSTKIVKNLESSISDIQLIPLFNDSICLASVRKIITAPDNYYALSGGVVFAVSKDGSLIQKVGNVGRGPGEYLSIKDIAMNTSRNELWCLDVFNTIIKYDVTDLNFVSVIETGKELGYAAAIVPLLDDSYAIFVPNPTFYGSLEKAPEFYCIRYYDKKGRAFSRDMLWTDYNIDAAFSIPVSCSQNNIYVLSPGSLSPGIVYKDGIEQDRLSFDFEHKNVPFRYAFKRGGNPMEMVGEIFDKDYYKLVSSVFFLPGAVYFSAYGKNSTVWNFIMKPDNLSGIRWESVGISTPPISAVGEDDGYLLFPIDDYGVNDVESDPLKAVLIQKYGIPKETGVSYLIKVKFNV